MSEPDESPALEREPTGQPVGGPTRLRVRRSPRYGRFLLTGALIGVVLALVGALAGPVDANTSRASLVGYLAMLLGLLGGLVGGVVAIAVDWAGRRAR